MAEFTPVPEQLTGDGWSARDMNKYLRDNFAAGVPGLMTTKGDIVVATAEDAATRVAVGADDHLLFTDSGQTPGVTWGYPDKVRVEGDSATTWAFDTGTAITQVTNLNTEIFDTGSHFADDTFTANIPAYYYVSFHHGYAKCQGNGGNWGVGDYVYIYLYKNDAVYSILAAGFAMAAADEPIPIMGADLVFLNKGDTLKLYASSDGPDQSFLGNSYFNLSIAPLI